MHEKMMRTHTGAVDNVQMQHDHPMVGGEHSPKEVAKFIAVLVGITAASLALWRLNQGSSLLEWLRWFMGVFFVVFAGFKLVGYKMFPEMFASYDIIAQRLKVYAYAYPFIELFLGLMYLWNIAPNGRDWVTLLIMGIGSAGVAQEIKRRRGIHCACLGNIIKLPLSTVSLVENVGMGVMALAMLLLR